MRALCDGWHLALAPLGGRAHVVRWNAGEHRYDTLCSIHLAPRSRAVSEADAPLCKCCGRRREDGTFELWYPEAA